MNFCIIFGNQNRMGYYFADLIDFFKREEKNFEFEHITRRRIVIKSYKNFGKVMISFANSHSPFFLESLRGYSFDTVWYEEDQIVSLEDKKCIDFLRIQSRFVKTFGSVFNPLWIVDEITRIREMERKHKREFRMIRL